MKALFLIVWLITLNHAIELDARAPKVTLKGENGGKLDGSPWHSKMIKTKVYVLFYVDPDEKDKNNLFSDMLKVKQYDQKHFGSIAVINMAASWLPNIILERALKEKQEKYPRTLYVKDKKKVLVNAWQLEDDASVVLVFDRKGRVIYHTAEQIEQKEGEMILELIEERLARSPLSCN